MSSDVEILELIDALDDIVHNAKPVPLTDQVRIDRESVYDLLDRMRMAAPEAIRRSRAAEERPAPAEDPPPAAPATAVDVQEAARSLPALVERVKFGGETIRIEAHGIPMAELRPARD